MMTETLGTEFTPKRLLYICALGTAMLGLTTAIAFIPDVAAAPRLYVGLYLASFALYAAAAALVWRSSGRTLLTVVLGFAVLFRLVLLPVRPTISTDIYRYLWDGRVASSGTNPYRYCPGSPRLKHLRNDNWRRINHPGTNTPYPPTSQFVFAANSRVFGENLYALKALFVFFDLAAIGLIILLLRTLSLPTGSAILYAWSPLVVTEFAGAGHQDVMGILLLLGAIYLAVRRRAVLSGAALAASALVKPYPLAAIPIFVFSGGARLVFSMVVAGVVLYWPYASVGSRFLLAGSLAYADKWRGNDGFFYVFELVFRPLAAHPEQAARLLSLAIVAAASLWLSLKYAKRPPALVRSVFILLAIVLLVSPTVYPWYVAWTVPLLCFLPNPGWLLFTGTVALVYLPGLYSQPLWLRIVEYVPVYITLAFSIVQARRRSEGRPPRRLDPAARP